MCPNSCVERQAVLPHTFRVRIILHDSQQLSMLQPLPQPRLFHSIEKLDNRSRPHSRHGDRQPNPHYHIAQDSGLSFFIRTTYARCELIFRSGVLRGLKQYKFCLCCIYICEKRGPRLHALYFELFVSIGFFEKPAKPTGKTLLETCTQ